MHTHTHTFSGHAPAGWEATTAVHISHRHHTALGSSVSSVTWRVPSFLPPSLPLWEVKKINIITVKPRMPNTVPVESVRKRRLCNWKSPQRALPSHPGQKARVTKPGLGGRPRLRSDGFLPLTQHFPPGESSVGKSLSAQPPLSFPVGSCPRDPWALTPSACLLSLARE